MSESSSTQEILSQKLALALIENDSLKAIVRNLTIQLESAEEIIVRLQQPSVAWEPPHHINNA